MTPEGFSFFRNRTIAGRLLGERLCEAVNGDVVVVTISTGGFPVGESVAGKMHAMTVYLPTLNIPDPADPAKTIGAANFGCAITNEENDTPGEYIYRQVHRLQQELKSNYLDQATVFSQVIAGNQVVVVNDVIDRTAPLLAAIKLIRSYGPKTLTLAAPVITVDAYMTLRQEVDDIVALETTSPHMLKFAFNNEDHMEFTDEIPAP